MHLALDSKRTGKPFETLSAEPAESESLQLAALLEEVAEDALGHSASYLQDTVVPGGGE